MIWQWLNRMRRRNDIEAEMREEMEFHRAARAADLAARTGVSPAEADRQARLEFGSVEHYREEGRMAFGFRWLDELRSDLRYGWRGIMKNPGYSVATAAILALAIGANAVFFALYSNYALKPLPIRDPDRYYGVTGRDQRGRSLGSWNRGELEQLRAACQPFFEGVFAQSGLLQVQLLAPVERRGMATVVSPDYFTVLGATRPAQGRLLQSEEPEPVVVLSHDGWQRIFPDEANPIGKQIRIRATWFTVIGVMPAVFTGTGAAVPDLWVDSRMRPALRDGIGEWQHLSGILRQGVEVQQVEAALSTIASRFRRDSESPLTRVELHPHGTYLAAEAGGGDGSELTVITALLFGTFLLVLAIACANLANLSLARMAARTHEMNMRFSLGAGRGRIVRQLLTESTLLALLGAAAGLGLGLYATTHAHNWLFSMAAKAGASVLPVSVDWRVFAYSAALGLAAGVAFGLLPALQATAAARHRKRTRPLRNLLLGSQVAASFVLLMLAGLLTTNIQRLGNAPIGFDMDRTFDLSLEPPIPEVLARLRQTPGVAGVSQVMQVPLYGRMPRMTVQGGSDQGTVQASYNYVDEHYFDTVGMRLSAGRRFRPNEEANVAVISESTARRLWQGQDALGRTVQLRHEDETAVLSYQVVGVVADVINGWVFEGSDVPTFYLSGKGEVRRSSMIRLQDSGLAALAAVREICKSAPGSTGCDLVSLREVAALQRFPFEAAAAIAAILGGLALTLTAIGLYSVVSFSVQQRLREIGVMLALGARAGQVTRQIVREAAWCLAGGVAVGLPFCLALSKLAASTMFRIRTFDPAAYFGVPILLACIAIAACFVPIRRALRVDPMRALRHD